MGLFLNSISFFETCVDSDQLALDQDSHCYYAPNFERVEGAYCFGLVRPSVHLFVRVSVFPSVTNVR